VVQAWRDEYADEPNIIAHRQIVLDTAWDTLFDVLKPWWATFAPKMKPAAAAALMEHMAQTLTKEHGASPKRGRPKKHSIMAAAEDDIDLTVRLCSILDLPKWQQSAARRRLAQELVEQRKQNRKGGSSSMDAAQKAIQRAMPMAKEVRSAPRNALLDMALKHGWLPPDKK
jgi:hypothetical protein